MPETIKEEKIDQDVSELIKDIDEGKVTAEDLKTQEETPPLDQPKAKRKTRRKKKPEPVVESVGLEDATSIISLPFNMSGKPLTPEENIRIAPLFSRWLTKRAGNLAEYAIDIALAIVLLEAVLNRLTKKKVKPLIVDTKLSDEELERQEKERDSDNKKFNRTDSRGIFGHKPDSETQQNNIDSGKEGVG